MSKVYLQVDLDAIDLAEPLAYATGLSTPEAGWGLIKTWKFCWREKREVVTATHLLGFFCSNPESRARVAVAALAQALITFEFLEPIKREDGVDEANIWRVKGAAERILRVNKALTAARRKGGLAAKGNLKQYQGKPAKAPKAAAKQQDLIAGEPPAPKDRAPSEWEEAWELMSGLAEDAADAAGVEYTPEDLEPRAVNAMLKKAATSIGVDATEIVDLWQAEWLTSTWAQRIDEPYALSAFLSKKVLPKLHERWASENAIREADHPPAGHPVSA